MSIKYACSAALGALLVVTTACSPDEPKSAAKAPGMANPASVNCIEIGGQSKIVTAADGNQVGFCHLPDGRVCEEWQLFRDKVCVPPKAGG